MNAKRGITQADWVISIGIFIIYLAWFFVVIRPVLSPPTKESLPADDLKDAFMENASWQVNVTPIILRSDLKSGSVPIIMDFPFSGNPLNYALKDRYWVLEDSRLIFLADFPQETVMYSLVHSTYNYSKPAITTSLAASDSSASSAGMSAGFKDGLLEDARYFNALRIEGLSMEVDGKAINTNNNEFSLTKISAKYKVKTASLNSTFYVLENNSGIYGFIDTREQKNVDLDFSLHEYGEYYVDFQNYGSIKYNVTECDNFESGFIDFTDEDYGLAFVFSDEVSIRMCHNKGLVINISASVDRGLNYRIIFHGKDEDKGDLSSPYTAIFGATNVIEGLSGGKMMELKDEDYYSLKDGWGMKHDFNITVSNSTATFLRLGKSPLQSTNVYSKIYYIWILDEYANQIRAMINILLW